MRTTVEKGKEATERATRATVGARTKVRAALEFYLATQQSYWGQYKVAYEQAFVDMENED